MTVSAAGVPGDVYELVLRARNPLDTITPEVLRARPADVRLSDWIIDKWRPAYPLAFANSNWNNGWLDLGAISISGGGGDITAPTAPTLSSPSKTSSSISLAWSGATDNVGVTGYDVYRGAIQVNVSPVIASTYTDTGLTASTTYSYTVRARDAAGNVSVASNTVTITTDAAVPTVVLDNYDGTPAYPNSAQNDLGKWTGANGFINGGGAGTVSAGAVNLQYSNAGWFGSDIYTDVSTKTYLVLRIKGNAGGEQSHFQLGINGATKMFNQFITSTGSAPVITTSYQDIKIPMVGNGINRASPRQLTLAFWFGASGTISIDSIHFE